MNEAGDRRKPGRPKDEERSARRQEEILEAAARVFAERGYAETDLQVVADELGVGKGTLYRYFPSKRELFLAAVDRGMHCLTEQMHEAKACAWEGGVDPLEVMEVAFRTYLAYFDAHPELVELMIQERAVFKDRKKPTYFEHRDATLGERQEMLRGLIAQGRFRDVPVERIIDVVNNLLYGTVVTNYFTGPDKPLEVQARDIVDILLNGILSEAERARRAAGSPSSEADA